jgi:pimeloyl-ACP methyl ester carboxylesterase
MVVMRCIHLVSRDIGFDTHALDIIRVLEYENLGEVMLVGHSYGGFSYRRRGRESSLEN